MGLLNDIIRDYKLGITSDPNNIQGITAALQSISEFEVDDSSFNSFYKKKSFPFLAERILQKILFVFTRTLFRSILLPSGCCQTANAHHACRSLQSGAKLRDYHSTLVKSGSRESRKIYPDHIHPAHAR